VRTLIPWFGALLVAAALTAGAQANPYYWPSLPQAPDACGPGFYSTNPYGMVYGPNYYLRPPWEPFNGIRPPMNSQPCGGGFGRYIRSPRDFFMYDLP
jgi:hypothetical protein